MTSAELPQVTVVTSPTCHFCYDAKAALAELGRVYPLAVRLIEAESSDGQALLHAHGAGMFPLVLVDGAFFSAGRLPRRKLARLLAARAAAPGPQRAGAR
jgi:glutaredoxin